jgi:trigger factor
MQTESQKSSRLEKQLDLAFPVAQVNSEVENRLKQLARTVRIRGFRPGKVPMKLVAQQYGGRVRQEVMSDSIQRAFSDAIRQQNFRVAGSPRIQAKKEEERDPAQLEFTATFEVYPDFEVGNIRGVTVRRPVVEVTEEDVARTIESLRKQRVHYEPTTAPAAIGDQVTIDYRGMLDGQQFEGGSASGEVLILGQSRLLRDFEHNLIDLEPGQSKTFELTYPGDYHGKELAGKTVTFEVALRVVAKARLPEIDAEFAKSFGIADGNVEAMYREVRANLAREVKRRVQMKVKDQVMQALLGATTIELPHALVEAEVGRLMHGAMHELQARGIQPKDVALSPDRFTEQARLRVALGLIVMDLVRREKLEARPEQVRALLEEHAQSYEKPAEMVDWYYQQPEQLKEVESVVLEENVVAWALQQANVEDVQTTLEELMGTNK